MSLNMSYVLPSASVAVPAGYAMALNPSKFVMVLGSVSRPWKPSSSGPGANVWINGPSGIWMPPGIGTGSVGAAIAGLPARSASAPATAPTRTNDVRRLIGIPPSDTPTARFLISSHAPRPLRGQEAGALASLSTARHIIPFRFHAMPPSAGVAGCAAAESPASMPPRLTLNRVRQEPALLDVELAGQ